MRVDIRPLRESDAETSVRWRNDPAIWLHTASRPSREVRVEDERDWIRRVIADGTGHRFAVLVDDVYVGNTYLTDVCDGVAEFHIFLGERAYWGRGIATRVTGKMLDFGRRTLRLSRIDLRVRPGNVAGVAAYRRAGFEVTRHDDEYVHMSAFLGDRPERITPPA